MWPNLFVPLFLIIIYLTTLKFSDYYNTGNYSLDALGRCKWSSHPDEPLLYVKYDQRLLNILDTEKKALILKSPIQIDSAGKYSRVLFLFCLFFQLVKED